MICSECGQPMPRMLLKRGEKPLCARCWLKKQSALDLPRNFGFAKETQD
jgi:NMD protein affecting ribosome stability and mRNA decay